MTSFKTRFAAALAAVASLSFATAAYADEPQRFSHDGRVYTYTTTTNAKGQTVLAGRTNQGGDFELIVAKRQVSGYVNGQPVAFSLRDARGAAKGARPVAVTVAGKATGGVAVAGTND
jgi:hypothetical protein